MKFAVIENEFGEIGVDERILHESIEEEVVEVMNGESFFVERSLLFVCMLSRSYSLLLLPSLRMHLLHRTRRSRRGPQTSP